MLSAARRGVSRGVAVSREVVGRTPAAPFEYVPVRSMATMQELRVRIRATQNVAKLTGVMKLVAASKLRSIEMAVAAAKPFGKSLLDSMAVPLDREAGEGEEEKKIRRLVIAVTTDRGLCGGVNSSMARTVRSFLSNRSKKEELTLFTLGEKGRAQLSRDYSNMFIGAVDGASEKDPSYPMACKIAERLVEMDYDMMTIFYNQFINAAKFENTNVTLPQIRGLPAGELPEKFAGYEIEPDNAEETLQNLSEMALAGSLYYILLESQACEVSQRVTAMDSASTNANDLADSLTLQAQKLRQAAITSELAEVVAGAESLEQ